MPNPFKIVSQDNKKTQQTNNKPHTTSKGQEFQARFDRLWLTDPRQFNPLRNCMEKERLVRTENLIKNHTSLKDKVAVDLGCGEGIFSKIIRDAGAQVESVDISSNALKALQRDGNEGIKVIQDFLPHTSLEDNKYDLVIAMDLIGYIPIIEHRLFMSELSRLVKSEGFVVCSTSLDINTQDAIQSFGSLAETEFTISEWKFNYHALHIRISNFFKAPARFAKAWKDHQHRKQQLSKKSGFDKWWYSMNTSKFLGWFWNGMQYLAYPIVSILENNRMVLLGLEKICRFLWTDSGISHAIFIGQRRPLIPPTKEELLAIEPKHKRQVWE